MLSKILKGAIFLPEIPNAPLENRSLSVSLKENIELIKAVMQADINKDFVVREFVSLGADACVAFLEGLSGNVLIDEYILRPCMEHNASKILDKSERARYLLKNVISINQAAIECTVDEISAALLKGMAVFMIDGCAEAILLDTRQYEKRPVNAPKTEAVVLGPQEGFIESLRTNLTLIRRYLASSMLVTEMHSVGQKISSQCAVVYLNGVVNTEILNRVRTKLLNISEPLVRNTGHLMQLMEENPNLLFPQILQTERPDRAVAALTDGQILILMDASPYALVFPTTIFDLIHASDDSFMRWQYGSFVRIVRLLGILISLYLPAVYIALTVHHSHMIPLGLLTSIAETRVNVPFPIIVEVLFMEFAFYLINEAGTRIPSQIGSALGIVGALILGQAAVSASIISPILIIIVALTGLGNYVVPNYSLGIGIEILRLLFLIAGGWLGLYGVVLASFITFGRLCAVSSFGVPFFAPVAPWRPHNPDLIARLPAWFQKQFSFYSRENSWLKEEKK